MLCQMALTIVVIGEYKIRSYEMARKAGTYLTASCDRPCELVLSLSSLRRSDIMFSPPPTSHPQSNMEPAMSALRVLDEVADTVPLVGFKDLVTITLHIVESAENVKRHKDGSRQLARHSAEIMCGIYEEFSHKATEIPDRQQTRIQDLERVLHDIEVFLEHKGKRLFLSRLIERWRTEDSIQQLAAKLDSVATSFQPKPTVDVSPILAQLHRQSIAQSDAILRKVKIPDQNVVS
ncbi:hypothetical protein A0H81_10864 [Grifola frondosa]|uniref:Uncharacterized protein n=1 Tax=Grifola frondosa TaxID=5627 RepID=A0A1C7LX43_GRIFR|nr:hypothetical protein A0H81_10864 [Grifola frondosa]